MITQEKLEAWIESKCSTSKDHYVMELEAAFGGGARSMIPLVLLLTEALEYYSKNIRPAREAHLKAILTLADADKMIGGNNGTK